ncbi:MAG: hypothetical protein J0M02_07960, partial [Planctomycetes bacterium]|nr:hypothetical protein [Planctomycetota bacterium]
MRILACAVLACGLACAEADALADALKLADGDAFAGDRMEQALSAAPVGKRRPLVERLARTGRDDVLAVLHRMIQDEDPQAAAAAITALAARWPTTMQDVELIRTLITGTGPAADAACAYAATVNDDEALSALVQRAGTRGNDQPSEQALRKLLNLPGGVGPEGWAAAVELEQQRYDVALSNAEKLLDGNAMDGIAAITLVAGLRPIGSRATRVLLRAAEHPDQTVRNAARSVLTTCPTPAAAAWRQQAAAERAAADAGAATATIEPAPVEP